MYGLPDRTADRYFMNFGRSQRSTWNPLDGKTELPPRGGTGLIRYYRDSLTQKNSTARATIQYRLYCRIFFRFERNALLNYQYQRS